MTQIVLNDAPEVLARALDTLQQNDEPLEMSCGGNQYVLISKSVFEEIERRLEAYEDARDVAMAEAILAQNNPRRPYDEFCKEMGLD